MTETPVCRDMSPAFVRDIPKTVRDLLEGQTVRASCGPHHIERTNDGGLRLSRASAKAVLEMLQRSASLTAGDRK